MSDKHTDAQGELTRHEIQEMGFEYCPSTPIRQLEEFAQAVLARRASQVSAAAPAAWVTPLRYGSQVTFYKPPKPESWDDDEEKWTCEPLFRASEGQAQTSAAADYIDAKAEKYLEENADIDPDTGATVFHYGEAGRDYHSSLVELAEEIRAVQSVAGKVCTVPPPGWNCTRAPGHEGPCAAWPDAAQLVDSAAPDVPDKMAVAFDNILRIQRAEAESAPHDSYMRGLYNGMSMICANIDGDLNWSPLAAPTAQQSLTAGGAVPDGWQGEKKEMLDALRYCVKALESANKTGREFALKNALEVVNLVESGDATAPSPPVLVETAEHTHAKSHPLRYAAFNAFMGTPSPEGFNLMTWESWYIWINAWECCKSLAAAPLPQVQPSEALEPSPIVVNQEAPSDLSVGDYVFASRWSDCDPGDPWAVGHVSEVGPNFVVVGEVNGRRWSNAMRITGDQGARIVTQYPAMETDYKPLAYDAIAEVFGVTAADQ